MAAFQTSSREEQQEPNGAPIGLLILLDNQGKIETREYWADLGRDQAQECGRELARIGSKLTAGAEF